MNSAANDSKVTKGRGRYNTRGNVEKSLLESPKTPKHEAPATAPRTPLTSVRNLENCMTPRRSGRKSIKPTMDYDDIVLTSATRSHQLEQSQTEQHKWTPAKVGRVSQKRSARKSKSVKLKPKLSEFSEEAQSSDGSDGKYDEIQEITKPDDENIQEVLNATFDKESNGNGNEIEKTSPLKDRNIKGTLVTTFDKESDGKNESDVQSGAEQTSPLTDDNIEEKINTTFDKESDGNGNEKEKTSPLKDRNIEGTLDTTFDKERDGKNVEDISQAKEGNIEEILNTTFEKQNDGKNVDEDISQQKDGNIEEILNTTFDKESDGNGNEKEKTSPLKDRNIEGTLDTTFDKENDGKTHDEEETKEEIAENKVVETKSNLPLDKLIEEGNDLGCTPILYDEEAEECDKNENENGKAKDLSCVSISHDSSFEKLEVLCDEVFEENPKPSNSVKSSEKTEKHNEIDGKLPQDERMEVESDDEMCVLILSDDEEELNQIKDTGNKTMNDTFNRSDCIIISPPDNYSPQPQKQKQKGNEHLENSKVKSNQAVQGLKTPQPAVKKKPIHIVPRIVVTNDKNAQETISTPKLDKYCQTIATPNSAGKRQNIKPAKATATASATKRQTNITPVSTGKRQMNANTTASTSKGATQQSRGYRFPTPFKTKKDFRFGHKTKDDKENENQFLNSSEAPTVLTTLEPKEIVLRSIRKRSLSVTIDGDQRKRRALNVTFFSPANQTASTADLDAMLAKSAAKESEDKTQCILPRKRSLSFDDSYFRAQQSKLPRPVLILKSPLKPKSTAPVRKKVPNFAAIHQKQFSKMENVVDYVARKAERAQILSNSALKARNAVSPSPAAKTNQPSASRKLPLTLVNTDAANNMNAAKKMAIVVPNEKKTQPKANTSGIINETFADKLKNRNQRHMNMFKARQVDSKSVKRKNAEIIRGVRSNRRFELMMEHRNLRPNNGS